MRFNQVIWDALCYAAKNAPAFEVGFGCFDAADAVKALSEYAAACDGTVAQHEVGFRVFEFIHNPIGKY
jgi:hypothetical protein